MKTEKGYVGTFTGVPVLHFKISDTNGNMVTTYSMVKQFVDLVKATVGEDYYVIATPYDLTIHNGTIPILNFDGIEYTTEEIVNLIEENKSI